MKVLKKPSKFIAQLGTCTVDFELLFSKDFMQFLQIFHQQWQFSRKKNFAKMFERMN